MRSQKDVQSLGGGKACGAGQARQYAPLAVGDLHFGEAEQVVYGASGPYTDPSRWG